MINRTYYSVRNGINDPSSKSDFDLLKKLFLSTYNRLETEGYFQKYFGKDCVDGDIPGKLGFGADIESIIFMNLRKEKLWPIRERINYYEEDDFFDTVEYLHDCCSQPTETHHHSFYGCGLHVDKADDGAGQQEFRETLNKILKDYKEGYEISTFGEILIMIESGFENLLTATVPTTEKENIERKINAAVRKFRRAKSSTEERREALRDLADVLEFLRPQAKELLPKKDERDLFNLANNFGIRHHNVQQRK